MAPINPPEIYSGSLSLVIYLFMVAPYYFYHTVRDIKSIDAKHFTAKVEKNKIVQYRAVVRIAFGVER